jgi:hypothetical protein
MRHILVGVGEARCTGSVDLNVFGLSLVGNTIVAGVLLRDVN